MSRPCEKHRFYCITFLMFLKLTNTIQYGRKCVHSIHYFHLKQWSHEIINVRWSFSVIKDCTLCSIHAGWNPDHHKIQELMGCMTLCRTFRILPELYTWYICILNLVSILPIVLTPALMPFTLNGNVPLSRIKASSLLCKSIQIINIPCPRKLSLICHTERLIWLPFRFPWSYLVHFLS